MQQNKNILIGGLLAIVLLMAVGYAAFATQLNITGSGAAAQSWKIGFVNAANTPEITTGQIATTANGTYTGQDNGNRTGGIAPSGTATFSDALTLDASLSTMATISATVNQPGDIVEFTLPIQNNGTLDAQISAVLNNVTATVGGASVTPTMSGNTATIHVGGTTAAGAGTNLNNGGNIQVSVSVPTSATLVKSGESIDAKVTVTYVSEHVTEATSGTVNFKVQLAAVQAPKTA